MLGHMLTQARHDQNGCNSIQFVHVSTYAFSMTRLTRWSAIFVVLTLKFPHPQRFSLDVSHFSFHDKFHGADMRCPLVENHNGFAQGHCNQYVSGFISMRRGN
jgi:hypothetical protein